jgi:hypothetical protein
MAGVGASMGAYGELTGEGKEGERREEAGARLGGSMGRGGLQEGHRGCSLTATAMCYIRAICCSLFRAEREVEERKRKEETEGKKEKKKTKIGKISEI